MSHLLRHLLLLVLLASAANVQLGKASNYALECGDDKSCAAIAKLTALINEMNNKLNEQASYMHEIHSKQAKDMEQLQTDLNRSLASTATISSQLGRHSTDLLSHDGRLKEHDVSQRNEYQLVQSIYGAELGPRDCSDIRERGYNASGIYRVYPGSDNKRIETDVYCDFQNSGQSWLVFQRRKDGSVDFERLWKDYANGFGNINGEFWLGNEKLSLLTMNRKYKLRIEMEDFSGEKRFAEYSTFSVKPVTDKYRLTVGGYSGNAGDDFSSRSGMQFSTRDADNDADSRNCAQVFQGGWWYNACGSSLHGLYLRGSHTSHANGINWYNWRGYNYSLKMTEMKIATVS